MLMANHKKKKIINNEKQKFAANKFNRLWKTKDRQKDPQSNTLKAISVLERQNYCEIGKKNNF